MCGICGIIHSNGKPVKREYVELMNHALQHRGPDSSGIYISPENARGLHRDHGPRVGLGHARLAILDLSERGHQPMSSADGKAWIVYNGEVFNFPALRDELMALGHRFHSTTDTEIVLAAYREWGTDAFARFNGMFALAIYEQDTGRMILARDHYGKKPLYYWRFHDRHGSLGMAFASELGALAQHPRMPRQIDNKSVSRYLQYEYVPAPHTILKGVRKLQPGHFLVWEDGEVLERQYWTLPFEHPEVTPDITFEEARDRLGVLLSSAIERRLVSDVPLGVFLSGGIDSSSLVALMADHVPANRIKTFSIGFSEDSFDETSFARRVAKEFGTDHQEEILTPQRMVDIIPEVWSYMSEPMADGSIFPTYLLCAFARKHVTVALGGDGGDEFFAGYEPFAAARYAPWFKAVPWPVRKLFSAGMHFVPASTKNMTWEFKVKQFLKGIDFPFDVRQQIWLGCMHKGEQKRFLHPDVLADIEGFDPLDQVRGAAGRRVFRDRWDQIAHHFQSFYMVGHILNKVDTASMANSLEVRAPFLDLELTAFANALPFDFKMRGATRKYVLKKLLERRLPRSIVYRSKKGFGIPAAKWFKEDLKPLLLDVFSPEAMRNDGLFQVKPVQALLNRHFAGERDERKAILTLLTLMMWKKRFLNGTV